MAEKDALTELLDDEISGWEEEVKQLQNQIPADEEDENISDDEEVEDNSTDDENEEEETDEEVSVADLQKQLEKIEKERRGLYKELKSERRTRQEVGGKLQSLEEAVQQILQQRQAAQQTDEPQEIEGIPFEFNDDGEAFIPKDKLAAIIKPLQDEINTLRQGFTKTTTAYEQQQAAQAAINKILSEDESYADAWPVYQKAREWANEQVIEWQKDNQVDGVLSGAQAMSYVFDQDAIDDFSERFPGLQLDQIVTAEDSDYFLKRTLSSIASVINQGDDEEVVETKPKRGKKTDERFTKVLQKPSGLGASANKGTKAKSILDTAADLSGLDAIDLSDEQAKALERALLREEQVNGIKF